MANAESTSVFKLDSKHRYNLISVLLTPVSGDRLRMVKPCWRPTMEDNGAPGGRVDGLLWYKDLGYHAYGEFSMAVIQANSSMEDQSQIESGSLSLTHQGPHGTFVGVYDGHGGPEASRFIRDRFLDNFKTFASQHQEISENVFIKAFAAMEEDFLSLVKKQWLENPQMASVGSCCLVGVICNGFLYIANVGDSRVVLGRAGRGKAGVSAMQLSVEHNANIESIRDELRLMHPCDPQIVVMKHRAWRVKGLIQVSRSIGDAYLKRPEFNREPLPSKFRLPAPFVKPILTWEPSISIQKLHPQDKFLIFASDGLWEHLSNHEAVDIVRNNPRNVNSHFHYNIGARLSQPITSTNWSLKKIDRGVRRHFHDDITVVVVYLDPDLINRVPRCISPGSVSCGVSTSTAIDS